MCCIGAFINLREPVRILIPNWYLGQTVADASDSPIEIFVCNTDEKQKAKVLGIPLTSQGVLLPSLAPHNTEFPRKVSTAIRGKIECTRVVCRGVPFQSLGPIACEGAFKGR